MSFGLGTILVMPDDGGGVGGLLTISDRSVVPFGSGIGDTESGAVLSNGTFMVLDDLDTFTIYAPNGSVITTPVPFTFASHIDFLSPMATIPGVLGFYASCIPDPQTGGQFVKIRRVASDGSLGATTYTLGTIQQIRGLVGNGADTIAYYGDAAVGGAIKRWDLVNNVALADFVAGATTNQIGLDAGIDANGNIWFAYQTNHSSRATECLKQWSPAGALLQTLTPPTSVNTGNAFDVRMALDIGDTTLVWAQTFPTLTTTQLIAYDIVTGAIKQNLTVPNGNAGEIPFSCPFFPRSFPSGGGAVETFVGTEQTRELVRVRQVGLPALPGNVTQFIGRAEVQMQPGLGVPADPTQAPTVQMAWSGDNAVTFNTAQPLSLGRTGAYYTRAYKHVVGSLRQPAVKLICSDDVTFVPTDLFVTREEGSG